MFEFNLGVTLVAGSQPYEALPYVDSSTVLHLDTRHLQSANGSNTNGAK